MESFKSQLKRNPFKNQDGKIVIIQFPNWQLWGVIVVNIAQRFIADGNNTTLKAAHAVFILLWAYEELTRVDNLFRRALGVFVIVTTFLSLPKSIN